MRSVVTDGTGAGAAVPASGWRARPARPSCARRSARTTRVEPGQPPIEEDTTDTDAWFTAFAPLRDPKVAVCVLLVGQGAGGATAAPAAKTVIEAALKGEARLGRHGWRPSGQTPAGCPAKGLRTSRSTMPVAPLPRRKRNSSGRFCSEAVLTLNSSSEPWMTPSEATESGSGIRLLGGIGSGW